MFISYELSNHLTDRAKLRPGAIKWTCKFTKHLKLIESVSTSVQVKHWKHAIQSITSTYFSCTYPPLQLKVARYYSKTYFRFVSLIIDPILTL